MLALQRLFHWKRTAPGRIALTQPMGGGVTRDFTWAEVADNVRRMAGHLQAQGWEPGSKVAILSKNCAGWMMSDLAIWMAGFVSVPLYPTLAHETVAQILAHSEARACFVGTLDGWEGMKPGVPAGLPCIGCPLSPSDVQRKHPGWEALCAAATPLAGEPVRAPDELATLICTSGTTGLPKGVMHSFGNFAWALDKGIERITMNGSDRMLSYLPLAHVVERMLLEHGWLRTGMRVWFADTLETFSADVQRARPPIFFSVPRLWVKFQRGVHHKLPPARLNRLLSIPIIGGLVRRKVLKALGLDQCRIASGGAAPIEDRLVMHEAVEACVVTGANLGQPLGIVLLTPESVAAIADPAARSALETSLGAHLKAVNVALDPHEQLACIAVTTTPWTVDNDLITPTFKVKRNRIEEMYAVNYPRWEGSGEAVIWSSA